MQLDSFEESLSVIFAETDCHWAGEGSTIIKETRSGDKFCFLAFLSEEGSIRAVSLLNDYNGSDATLSNLIAAASTKKKNTSKQSSEKSRNRDADDVRLRRKRAQPQRKHPIKNHSAPKRL